MSEVAAPAAPSAPANATPSPPAAKPGPVVQVKPKPAAPAQPTAPRMVEYTDPESGQKVKLPESEAAALVRRGRSMQDMLTGFDKKKTAFERREQEFNARLERLKGDPAALREFLQSNGIQRGALESILSEDLKNDTLNEDQRALLEERKKREALEKQQQEREEQEQEAQHKAATERERANYVRLFNEALTELGIPEGLASYFHHRQAAYYAAATKNGHQPDVRSFTAYMKQGVDALVQARASSLGVEELEGFIGKRKWKPSDDAEEVELDYPTLVHQRNLQRYRKSKAGVPGVATAPVKTGGATSDGALRLPDELVRNFTGDLQNAYYKMITASAEELPGRKQRFLAEAKKAGVKLP